jgi:hypothetical protein
MECEEWGKGPLGHCRYNSLFLCAERVHAYENPVLVNPPLLQHRDLPIRLSKSKGSCSMSPPFLPPQKNGLCDIDERRRRKEVTFARMCHSSHRKSHRSTTGSVKRYREEVHVSSRQSRSMCALSFISRLLLHQHILHHPDLRTPQSGAACLAVFLVRCR